VQGCLLRVSEIQLNDPQTLYRRLTIIGVALGSF
jgi:hypothetical protein